MAMAYKNVASALSPIKTRDILDLRPHVFVEAYGSPVASLEVLREGIHDFCKVVGWPEEIYTRLEVFWCIVVWDLFFHFGKALTHNHKIYLFHWFRFVAAVKLSKVKKFRSPIIDRDFRYSKLMSDLRSSHHCAQKWAALNNDFVKFDPLFFKMLLNIPSSLLCLPHPIWGKRWINLILYQIVHAWHLVGLFSMPDDEA